MKRIIFAALSAIILLSACGGGSEGDLSKRYPDQEISQTSSGLQYFINEEGTGDRPEVGDTVSVHYTGTLDDGTVFDSSVERGTPIEFPLGVGYVIPGWDEGIALMKEGGKATLIIPSDLGYGEQGSPPTIPGGATLHFEVELVEVIKILTLEERYPGADILTTESGLQYFFTEEGEGRQAEAGDTVLVHYVGSLDNGVTFDSSYDRGQPFEFVLGVGNVIPGWDEGIALLKIGGKAVLIIPPSLGYGNQGAGGVIPAGATLFFEVELVDAIPADDE